MSMTRKDCNRVLIAVTTATASRHCKLAVIRQLAAAFQTSEANFDQVKFLAAADLMMEALDGKR